MDMTPIRGDVMLKEGDSVFLDDITLEEVAEKLKTCIFPVMGVEKLILAAIAQ